MSTIKDNIKKKAKWLYGQGFAHIVGSSFINKIFHFVANAFIVRILTKVEYGTFGFADSIMAFVIALTGLGMTNGVLQFCSEKRPESEKKAFDRFGLKLGVAGSIILSIFCLAYAFFGYFKNDKARMVLALYSLYPLFYFLFEFYSVSLRWRKQNKAFALITNINAGVYAVFGIIGCLLFNEMGIVIGLYMGAAVAAFVGKLKVNTDKNIQEKKLTYDEKKGMVRFSLLSASSRVMTNLLIFIDVFLIGIIILDPADLASYRVATTIPLALMFVPNSIIMFAYPYIAENRTKYEWLIEKLKTLLKMSFLINLVISLLLIIFAPLIIKIIWGNKYINAVLIFRLLSINYFMTSTFRYNMINILTALNRVGTVLAVNIITGVLNIVMDIFLIKFYGATGAAVATLAVVSFTILILVPVSLNALKKIKSGIY